MSQACTTPINQISNHGPSPDQETDGIIDLEHGDVEVGELERKLFAARQRLQRLQAAASLASCMKLGLY